MAKKKYSGKKHRFKHAEPSSTVLETRENGAAPASAAPNKPRVTGGGAAVAERDFSYVAGDLRRIAVMAAGFILLEVILWFVFGHTGLGDSIYHLVQV
jgi:hypothetical protein